MKRNKQFRQHMQIVRRENKNKSYEDEEEAYTLVEGVLGLLPRQFVNIKSKTSKISLL